MAGKRTVQVLLVVNIALLVAQLFWMWIYGRDVALLLACASGDSGKFLVALLLGANPNARTSNGTTALMLAVGSGNWTYVYDLVQRGADVNIRNEDGETALYTATRVGDANAVNILLRHGADPNVTTYHLEVTPLMMAARRGDVKIVEL